MQCNVFLSAMSSLELFGLAIRPLGINCSVTLPCLVYPVVGRLPYRKAKSRKNECRLIVFAVENYRRRGSQYCFLSRSSYPSKENANDPIQSNRQRLNVW